MDWGLFASAFGLVFVAELPGKTTLATLLMASRSRPLPVFVGAAGAFLIHSAIAVAAGGLIGFLPPKLVNAAAGLLFLGLALLLWRGGAEDRVPPQAGLATAFAVVFLGQWGDPSQLATAALAARYHAPAVIFASATLALWAVSALAAAAGRLAKTRLHPEALRKGSSLVFAAVGLFLLFH